MRTHISLTKSLGTSMPRQYHQQRIITFLPQQWISNMALSYSTNNMGTILISAHISQKIFFNMIYHQQIHMWYFQIFSIKRVGFGWMLMIRRAMAFTLTLVPARDLLTTTGAQENRMLWPLTNVATCIPDQQAGTISLAIPMHQSYVNTTLSRMSYWLSVEECYITYACRF